MKRLKKILLINWLYFSKQVIEVGDVNFLTGFNGAGKSTIIDALQIVLLGETNARNFNQAANEKSQRTLDGYLRADMDENNPHSRRGKDFSSYIACEFWDDIEEKQFVAGIVFDCTNDGNRQERFFLYDGVVPEDCFIREGAAMDIHMLRAYIKQEYGARGKLYDIQKEYRDDLLAKWNVHNEQVMRMMKKAVSFKPITDIQKFITENICDIPEKPDIMAMQQNIRDYKRHEQLAKQQEEKLAALQEIARLYREMQQAVERWQIHFFLAQWGEKEKLEADIRQQETRRQQALDELTETGQTIQELTAQAAQKEEQREALERDCVQSDVFQEERRLRDQKGTLQQEREKLVNEMDKLGLNIRQVALRVEKLHTTVQGWAPDESLCCVQEAAATARQACAAFAEAGREMFARPLALFEAVQDAVERLSSALQDAAYTLNRRLADLQEQSAQKRAALANLKKDIKDYSGGLLALKTRLSGELERSVGCPVEIDILADVLEVTEEAWRGAVEGYLNTQKFYLLVDPSYYNEALRIYDRIKKDFGNKSFGLVDVGKLRERETIAPREDSLAQKIKTDHSLARSYIDYLLGRVVCCAHVDQLRQYKTAITADGMLYQGYVARPLRRDWMEDAFIGRQAVSLRMKRLEKELGQIEAETRQWEPVGKVLASKYDFLFTPYFVQNNVKTAQESYLRVLAIKKETEEIDDRLSHLDLLWLDTQRQAIADLKKEIAALHQQKEQRLKQEGQLQETIRQLEYGTLPELYQKRTDAEERITENFSQEYQQQTGIPRYQQELKRLKKPAVVSKNFSDQLNRTRNEQEQAKKKLFDARAAYADRFKPCPFSVDAMDNGEYEAEQLLLEESELPRYHEKIKAARESAMEQFQNDFLAKLKSSIDQVQEQVRSLNKALKQAQFGTDRYQFKVGRNPDYADYYDMIMAPELMEGDAGLFALPFQQKYGDLIQTLFDQITMSDDTQLNARKQSELQQNIEKFTDFRTYLKFDLETTDQNGSKQLLSQTLNTKSGGETQTPFYIAVLASFAQMYQVNNPSGLANNTVRLVMFDEAFNKMDSDRIVESVRLLRKMGLQAIICTPPDKLSDIMPLADKTLLVNKDKYRMWILDWGKEVLRT